MSSLKQNWYEMAKAYSLKEYLEKIYLMDFSKGKKALCPFHADSNPSLGIFKDKSDGTDRFNCASCGTGGDITKFVELKEGIESLEAVKKVLLDHGVDVGGEVKELTLAQQEERKEIIAKNALELKKKKEVNAQTQKKAHEFAVKNMNLIAHKYSGDLNTAIQEGNEQVIAAVEKVFPKYFMIEGALSAVGWDEVNESVVLITRHIDGNVMNIKRRTMVKNFSNWDVSQRLYDWKGDGKWIGWKDAVTYPFGLPFQKEKDDRIIICEGEKDALNLISLGVNALTLGGVTSKWENHLEFLKNKKVYIWFDHDKAGYLNALKKFYEIKEVTKSCQVVLFLKLEQTFPNKGDVSDYLNMHDINLAEEVFNRIIYSSFVPYNELIQELDDYYDWQPKDAKYKAERPSDFLVAAKQLEFADIKDDILKNARKVRGENDNELNAMQFLADELNNSENKKNIELMITTLFNNQPGYLAKELETIKKFTSVKKTVLSNYRQVHIHDIAQEALRTINSSGYMFAKYRGGLYLWTGAYYYKFKVYSNTDSEIGDFIFQKFFTAIELDFKKKTVENCEKVVKNVQGYAQSLEEWIDKSKRILTMQNGALVINSNGKHFFKYKSSKKDCAFNVLDIHYDEKAEAPKWEKFLNRVLPDENDQKALMEFVGYCLMPSHRFEKFLLLYGETGANGKSVVLDVIKSFFGKENVSGLQLQNFMGHELDSLTGKILNIGSELDPKADLKTQMSVLKSLVSPGDVLTINPKFEKGYELHAEEKPKVAFASNGIPKSGVDGGFFRRVLAFSFDQEIKDNEKIRDLVERFSDEKAGILNLALLGLERLIKQGKFSMSEKRALFMEQYRDDADPIRVYAKESLVSKKGIMVAKNYIYEHYKEWCTDRGHHPASQRTLFTKLKSATNNFSEKRTTVGKDELLPSNCWYVENVAFSKGAIEKFNYKGVKRESKNCMIDASSGVQVIFD